MRFTRIVLGYFASLASAQGVNAAAALTPQKTLTYTATSTSFATVWKTVHNLTHYATGTIRQTGPTYVPVYKYNGNTTYTETGTSIVYKTVSARTTTKVPTKAGFTPILSQSYYNAKIVVVNTTVTSTYTATTDPSPKTETHVFVRSWSTTLTTTSSVDFPSTVVESAVPSTVTSTYTQPPVETDYAACRPNNFASRIPTGQPIRDIDVYGPNAKLVFYISSARDCCTTCHKTPGCFGGGYQTYPGTQCYLFVLKNTTAANCKPKMVHPWFRSEPYHEEFPPGATRPSYNYEYTAFNGPCGQVGWIFNSRLYFPKDYPDFAGG